MHLLGFFWFFLGGEGKGESCDSLSRKHLNNELMTPNKSELLFPKEQRETDPHDSGAPFKLCYLGNKCFLQPQHWALWVLGGVR